MVMSKVWNATYCGACRYTGYEHKSIRLTLECGHEITRKASAGIPLKARCHDCSRDETALLREIMQ